MILVPYRLDAAFYKIPVLTIAVCLICIATFLSQLSSNSQFEARMRVFCGSDLSVYQRAIVDHIDDDDSGSGCANTFLAIRKSADHDQAVSDLAAEVNGLDFYPDKEQDLKFKQDALRDGYAKFETEVPTELTDRIMYRPDGYNVVTMVTSTFAHGSWIHLIGNLFFFFAFACCVECVLGTLHFVVCFLLMAIITSVAYSHSIVGAEAVPTLGLSGVAMGMMALLTVLLPRARVWCLFWFLLWVRRFTLPVLLVAMFYIGWNVYDLHHDLSSNINYVAHVSGALTGIALGFLYRMFAPQRMDSIAMVADV